MDRFTKWSFCILAVGALACAGGGGGSIPSGSSSDSTPSSGPPKAVAAGKPMKADNGEQVTVVGFNATFSTGNPFDDPGAGKQFVQVAYTLVNGSSTEWSLPLFELKLIDSNGVKYVEALVSSGEDSVDSLAAGGHVTAHVVYAVAKGLHLNVAWQPDPFSDTVLETILD